MLTWTNVRSMLRTTHRSKRTQPLESYWIRHSLTNDYVDGLYRAEDAEVTEEGVRQAKAAAARIADLMPELIITSTYPRAVQLANEIVRLLPGVRVISTSLFSEVRKPSLTRGKGRKDPRSLRIMRWTRALFDLYYWHSGAEGRWQLERRMRQALDLLENLPVQRVVVVTHGKWTRMAHHYIYENGTLCGFYRKGDKRLRYDPTGITEFEYSRDYRTGKLHWHIGTWNDTAHLDSFVSADLAARLHARGTGPHE